MILSAFCVLLKIGKILLILKTFIRHKARSSYVYNLHIVYAVASNTTLKRIDVTWNIFLDYIVSWAFLRHLVVVVVIWKNQNFQNFQTIQAFYIHNGTSQNSLSTTFNTTRAWWTQIWFTPLVSWKEGLEYVKSFAYSLRLWCLGWERERQRYVHEEPAS